MTKFISTLAVVVIVVATAVTMLQWTARKGPDPESADMANEYGISVSAVRAGNVQGMIPQPLECASGDLLVADTFTCPPPEVTVSLERDQESPFQILEVDASAILIEMDAACSSLSLYAVYVGRDGIVSGRGTFSASRLRSGDKVWMRSMNGSLIDAVNSRGRPFDGTRDARVEIREVKCFS